MSLFGCCKTSSKHVCVPSTSSKKSGTGGGKLLESDNKSSKNAGKRSDGSSDDGSESEKSSQKSSPMMQQYDGRFPCGMSGQMMQPYDGRFPCGMSGQMMQPYDGRFPRMGYDYEGRAYDPYYMNQVPAGYGSNTLRPRAHSGDYTFYSSEENPSACRIM